MQLFFEIVRRSWRRYMTYRAATVAGLATNFFFGLLRVAVLLALYGDRGQFAGYSRADAVAYVGLTQAVLVYLSFFGWYELTNSIYTGEVGADLLKPEGLFKLWFARDVGRAGVGLLLRGVLFILLFELVVDLSYPTTLLQWGVLALTLPLSLVVSFGWRFFINLAAFWTPEARGIVRLGTVVSMFFSGLLMPLAFFPTWVQQIAAWTPFPHLLNTSVEVWVGVLTPQEMFQAVLLQIVWAVVLILLCQWGLQRGVRRLVILGG